MMDIPEKGKKYALWHRIIGVLKIDDALFYWKVTVVYED